MNKKGQIFLIAALVIVIVMSGFGIYNLVKTPKENSRVYDLSNEINYENGRIIDRGVYEGASSTEIVDQINNTISYYAKANPDSEIAIIYGDAEEIKARTETNLFYTFKDIGGANIDNARIQVRERNVTSANMSVNGQIVTIKIGDQRYNFNITQGQNFYLVVKINKEGGQFVKSQ